MNRKGQAALEVTIFGILFVLIIYGMVSYGQRLSYQQQVRMEGFRAALKRAYDNNGVASYLLKKNERLASAQHGFLEGTPARVDGMAAIMWQKGISGPANTTDEQGHFYTKVDDFEGFEAEMTNKTYVDYDGTKRTVKTPHDIWEEDLKWEANYKNTLKKDESASGISYDKNVRLDETVKHTFHWGFDKAEYNPNKLWVPQYDFNMEVDEDEVTRSRSSSKSWQTSHD